MAAARLARLFPVKALAFAPARVVAGTDADPGRLEAPRLGPADTGF
jgi:hypothetical protein